LVGCGDKIASEPNPAKSVSGVAVLPATLSISPGQKFTLNAVVTAGPEQSNLRVRWRSSQPAVASVDSNGVVSSIAAGLTTITATSLADTLYSGSCAVLVFAWNGTITIQGINDDGRPADLSSLSGKIDVIVNVESSAPTVARVEALLTRDAIDSVVASFSPGGSTAQTTAEPTTLSFSTMGLKNGQYLLRVRLTLTNGSAVASATVQLTIKNP
jgi:uncharacterized protein YjdB